MKQINLYNRLSIIASILIICTVSIFSIGCKGDKNTQPKEGTGEESGMESEMEEPKIKLTIYASIQPDKTKVFCLSDNEVCTLNVPKKMLSKPLVPNEKIGEFMASPDGKYIVYYKNDQLQAYNLTAKSKVNPANADKNLFSGYNKWIDTDKLLYNYAKPGGDNDYYLYTIDSNGETSNTRKIEPAEAAMYLGSIISGDFGTHISQDEKGRIFYKKPKANEEGMLLIEQFPYDIAISYDGKRVAYSTAKPDGTYIYDLADNSNLKVSKTKGEEIQFNPFNNNIISFIGEENEYAETQYIVLNTQTKEAQAFQTEYIHWIDENHFFQNVMERGPSIFNIEADIVLPYQLDAEIVQIVVNNANK